MGEKVLVSIVSGGKLSCMGARSTGKRVLIQEDPPTDMERFPKYVLVEIVGDVTLKTEEGKVIEWFLDREKAITKAEEVGASIELGRR